MYYYNLSKYLNDRGFTVTSRTRTGPEGYRFFKVEGRGVEGGFCSEDSHCDGMLNGHIIADNRRCFEKWRKCPVCLPLPKTDSEREFLVETLLFLGSDEGFELSSVYEMDYIKKYPDGDD